jgi:hypothetical protein
MIHLYREESMSTTTIKEHELKCWPEFFEPIFVGLKKFDLRKNDRDFKVGDIVLLREFKYTGPVGRYTGRVLRQRISYMLEGIGGSDTGVVAPLRGLERGFVILGYMDTSQ